MTNDLNRVRLVVGGLEFAGWKSVSVSAGIERAARDFDLSVTERWPGGGASARQVRQGEYCELFIGSDRVVSGYVDAVPIRYAGDIVQVSVRGRSKTADLVDCAAINSPGQWRGLKVEDIAQALASPYAVEVVTQVDTGPALAEHQVEPGESAFESIDRMLRLRQLLAADDEFGRLVLLQAGSRGRASTALELGANVWESSAGRDYSQVFSEYICQGQRAAASDDEWSESVGEQQAVALQPGLSRRRVLLLRESGQADEGACQDRVDFERAYRMTRAREVVYTVRGWRQGGDVGVLWLPNLVVPVRDRLLGLDEDFLVSEVSWTLDEGGMRAELKVGPAAGYLNKVARPAKAGAKSGGASGGGGDLWADVR